MKRCLLVLPLALSLVPAISHAEPGQAEEELSDRGRTLVQCMTLYSAIKDVVADENVELKRPQTITPDSPRMHILYARAKEREEHFNVVLGGRLEDLTMKEFAAIYPVMKAEAAAGYPDFKNLYGPFETCDQQQKWLQEQGIEFNAQF